MKHISMRGQTVDMARLVVENANAVALGNASMNVRGDIIGTNGNVVKSREQIVQEYHATNPKAVKQVALRDIHNEVFASPAEAVAAAREAVPDDKTKKRRIADTD